MVLSAKVKRTARIYKDRFNNFELNFTAVIKSFCNVMLNETNKWAERFIIITITYCSASVVIFEFLPALSAPATKGSGEFNTLVFSRCQSGCFFMSFVVCLLISDDSMRDAPPGARLSLVMQPPVIHHITRPVVWL